MKYDYISNLLFENLETFNPLVITVKLLLALICGGIIGMERGRHNQPAGLRTHIIISLGACLMMVLSMYLGDQFGGDQARLAAQVVSGIGFLGGAAIIRFKYAIKGVTTVATIWTTAGIGLTIGSGLYVAGLIATGFVMFTLIIVNIWEKKVIKTSSISKLNIHSKRNIDLVQIIFSILKGYNIKISSFGLSENMLQNTLEMTFTIRVPSQIKIQSLFYDISTNDGIIKIDLE